MNVLQKIARALTDQQLIGNLNRLTEALDSFNANEEDASGRSRQGIDPETEETFRRDLALRDALRNEYRDRVGEVI